MIAKEPNASTDVRKAYIASAAIFAVAATLFVGWLRSSYQPIAQIAHSASSWRSESSLLFSRRALALATNGRFLYAVGGVDIDNNYVDTIEVAEIELDGLLGPWRGLAQSLPDARFYLGAAVVSNRLYAIGGGTGPLGDDNVPSAAVHSAPINNDGSIGAWRSEAFLSTPRRGLQLATWNGQLFAVGGYNGKFLRSVDLAVWGTDGSILEWRLQPHEAQLERYMHATTASNDRLYVLTGHVEGRKGMGYGSVESAPLGQNGISGPWLIEQSNVLQPRFLAAAVSANNSIFLLAGHNGTQRLASVEYASTTPNGLATTWRPMAPVSVPRSAFGAVVAGDRIYLAGGSGDSPTLASVESIEHVHHSRF